LLKTWLANIHTSEFGVFRIEANKSFTDGFKNKPFALGSIVARKWFNSM
jgi:hypothetical protein